MQQRFVSDVSHELRTPLTTIRMAGEILHDSRHDFTPSVGPLGRAAADPAGPVRVAARRPARDQPVRRRARRRWTSSRSTCATSSSEPSTPPGRWPTAGAAGSSSRATGEPCVATIDPRRVERILRNLVVNAIEHGEGRPVTVRLGRSARGGRGRRRGPRASACARARPSWSSTGSGGPTRPGPGPAAAPASAWPSPSRTPGCTAAGCRRGAARAGLGLPAHPAARGRRHPHRLAAAARSDEYGAATSARRTSRSGPSDVPRAPGHRGHLVARPRWLTALAPRGRRPPRRRRRGRPGTAGLRRHPRRPGRSTRGAHARRAAAGPGPRGRRREPARAPSDIVRGFLRAQPGPGRGRGRRPAVPHRVDAPRPGPRRPKVVVYPDESTLHITAGAGGTFTVTTPITATVDENGVYVAAPAGREGDAGAQAQPGPRSVADQRTSTTRSSCWLTSYDIERVFAQVPLYYVAPGSRVLVPDLRWFPQTSGLATVIARAQLAAAPAVPALCGRDRHPCRTRGSLSTACRPRVGRDRRPELHRPADRARRNRTMMWAQLAAAVTQSARRRLGAGPGQRQGARPARGVGGIRRDGPRRSATSPTCRCRPTRSRSRPRPAARS